MVDWKREIRKVWEKEEGLAEFVLCKILVSATVLDELPGNVVWKMLLCDGKKGFL